MPTIKYDLTFNIFLVGNSGTGKSSISEMFRNGHFVEVRTRTVGVDCNSKIVRMNDKTVLLNIWDTSGRDQCNSSNRNHYLRMQGVMLVYNVRDENSFKDLEIWLKELNQYCSSNCATILIGNFCDKQREISQTDGNNLAKSFNIPYIETSAKTGTNIDRVFFELCEKMYSQSLAEQRIVDLNKLQVSPKKNSILNKVSMLRKKSK